MTHRGTVPSAFPIARTVFLSRLVSAPSDRDTKTLVLKDREVAATARGHLAALLTFSADPRILILDLAGLSFTPSALQELILPLAQRIRGGEHGMVHLVITTTDAGVGNFIRYMAQAHQLPLYLAQSPFDIRAATPIGVLTTTNLGTLDAINVMGGQVTASGLATAEGIGPSAATNRLVALHREGYLIRQPRGRRDGDLYVEPRAATSTPIVCDQTYEIPNPTTALRMLGAMDDYSGTA